LFDDIYCQIVRYIFGLVEAIMRHQNLKISKGKKWLKIAGRYVRTSVISGL